MRHAPFNTDAELLTTKKYILRFTYAPYGLTANEEGVATAGTVKVYDGC
jgi:hypothetical protein